ncbi:MAG: carbohydrate binding family 9 domain-containing protein, partial [Kangiellaceae bacterium]|nr:carbohydrate binding family 9 domain-containing protein [Kangiellaceae bacterium]
MKHYFKLLLVVVVYIFCLKPAQSKQLQSQMLGEVPLIEAELSIDGIVDDAVWQQALTIELDTETSPSINTRAKQKTTAYVFENGTDLYIAFRAFDVNPKEIRAFHSERDKIWNSDVVGVKLDPLNSGRIAYQYFVTPLGIQADSVLDDSSDNEDTGWDSIWYSKAKIHDNGYDVEIKIALDSLRISSQEGLKSWGIELVRLWPRDVLHQFSSQSKSKNQQCDVCQFKKVVGFKAHQSNSNVTLIPSVTLKRTDILNDELTGQWQKGELEERGSLDFRWGINQNTFFNATINPDFSQVEADALQLDVNSLSVLSLDEKRPFFMDGTEYFKHWSRFIYTRIFSEPKVGMKITSTQNQHNVGAMLLEDK